MSSDPLPSTIAHVPPDPLLGRTLGRYQIVGFLGRGGMGSVYRAHDPALGRDVALKLLGRAGPSDAEAQWRFEREMRSLGQLEHPNVLRVLDVGRDGDQPFFIMELAAGSVQEHVRQERPTPTQTRAWLIEACRGLQAVHAAGYVHRDLKPSNLLLMVDGTVKLADFGLVQSNKPTADDPGTTTPTLLGTPHYMSPEQCRCEPTDARSDIYSLGATFFALLTGRPPFLADDPLKVLFAHCSTPAPDPRTLVPTLPDAYARLVLWALEKKPADRPPDAATFLAALQALDAAPHAPVPAAKRGSRRWWLPLGLVVCVAIIGLAVTLWPPKPPAVTPPEPELPKNVEETWSTAWDAGGPVTALATHPTDAQRVLWGTASGAVVDAEDGKPLYRYVGGGAVRSVAYILGGRQGYAALVQHGLVVWDARTHTELYTKPPAECGGEISALAAWGPHSTIAALSRATSAPGCFRVWHNGAHTFPAALEAWSSPVWALASSGPYLFAGGDAGSVQAWQPTQQRDPLRLMTSLGRITTIVAWDDGQRFAVTDGKELQVWHRDGKQPPHVLRSRSEPGEYGALAVSPDGRYLAMGLGATLHVQTTGDRRLFVRAEHQRPIQTLAFSADGTALFSGAQDGQIRRWPTAQWPKP